MRLSKNFDLDEFLVSQVAARRGIDMTPPPKVLENLKWFVPNYMQVIRDAAGAPIAISSGFRPPELNVIIGGSSSSAHMYGLAADFRVFGMTPYETVQMIEDLNFPDPYDQVINEFGRWVHLGVSFERIGRNQTLTAFRDGNRTEYEFGLRDV